MEKYKLNKDNSVEKILEDEFPLEKDIQRLVEKNSDEIFNLEFVKSEFTVNNLRIDSLCFDHENQAFVIIEYKKGNSYSVIDQGYTYLSLMLQNKAEFILEYNESKNQNLTRDKIQWGNSRVIFVSTYYNKFQKNSINFQDIPFELWEIKKFRDNSIIFDQIISNSNEKINSISSPQNKKLEQISKEIQIQSPEELFKSKGVQDIVVELYEKVLSRIEDWENLNIKVLPNKYIKIQNGNKVKIYLHPRKDKINIGIVSKTSFTGEIDSVKNAFILKDPYNLFKMYKDKSRHNYTGEITRETDIDYLVSLIKQKYDENM